jgi:glyoxylase-like metal-dependent hydrolase (beta-lactamase superfamily II)
VNVDDLYEQVRREVPVGNAADTATVPHQVAPGIRVLALRTPTLPPAAHTNAYLVGSAGGDGTGEQVLVDPGSPYPDQQALLDAALTADAAAGRPLAAVALTHHHGDHAGGAAAVAARWRVPVVAHAATARRLAGKVEVTRLLADGDEIAGMIALHTPGHADGHLCFARDGATIAGDMVASIGTILVDPSEGDMALYMASLERLRARPQTTLLPAHGAPIPDGHAKLDEYLAHRRMRETRIIDALRSWRDASPTGVSIDELVAAVYADTPRVLWPLAARSLRAHLDKLVAETRVRALDGERFAAHTL